MIENNPGFCCTAIQFANREAIQQLCSSMEGKKVVLVMSKTAAVRHQWEDTIRQLQTGCDLLWIEENVAYPTQQTLLMGIEKVREFEADVILAIGGGSSIDFAKGLKAFWGVRREWFQEYFSQENASQGNDVQEQFFLEKITEYLSKKKIDIGKGVEIIAVPTTAGTGSELTQWATIWDYQKNCKYSLDHPALKPDQALILPELTIKADIPLTIATGLDSLSHAVEAYWSKKTNPLVRSLACQSIKTTVTYLSGILRDPENLIYREKQCLASVLSGLAFSATRTTACHSISYSLTMDYHIPHGIAVAMTLAQVAERNRGAYLEEELLDCFRPYRSIGEYLRTVCGGRVSLCLKDYGVKQEDIPVIAGKSFTLGRMDNNPVELTLQDVEEILKEILE